MRERKKPNESFHLTNIVRSSTKRHPRGENAESYQNDKKRRVRHRLGFGFPWEHGGKQKNFREDEKQIALSLISVAQEEQELL